MYPPEVREGCVQEGNSVREGNVRDIGVCAQPHVQGVLGVDDIPADKKHDGVRGKRQGRVSVAHSGAGHG